AGLRQGKEDTDGNRFRFAVLSRRQSVDELAQSSDRRRISDPIDACRPEMALESGDGGFRLGVIDSGYIDAIAIAREHRLERLDFETVGVTCEVRTIFDGAGGHEMTDPGLSQMGPRKMFA